MRGLWVVRLMLATAQIDILLASNSYGLRE